MGVCGDWDFAAGCIYGCSSEANCYRRRRAPAHPDSLLGVGARLAVAAVDLTKERDALRTLLADQSRRIGELEGALKPFADIASPKTEELGATSPLQDIIGKHGTDELVLSSHVGESGRSILMSADDFIKARNMVSTALKAEEGNG